MNHREHRVETAEITLNLLILNYFSVFSVVIFDNNGRRSGC